MSYLVVAPESFSSAASDLSSIGSTLTEAHRAAATSTTSVVAAARDEVSVTAASLFSSYGQQFQAAQAEAAAFHSQFAKLLGAAGSTYNGTEAAAASSFSLLDKLKLNWDLYKIDSQLWNDLTSGKTLQDFNNWFGGEISDRVGTWVIEKLVGGETTWLGIETGAELGIPGGPLGILGGAITGGIIGHYTPDVLGHAVGQLGLQKIITSLLNGQNPFTGVSSYINSSVDNLEAYANTLFGIGSTGGPLSGWNGLGPSIAITSDVVGPWGADGIQQDVTGVFDIGAGPFSVQVGSFQGMSAADMYGGMASVSATAFGIRESGSVYSSDGGAPQFSFSVDVPAVTSLVQDLVTYFP